MESMYTLLFTFDEKCSARTVDDCFHCVKGAGGLEAIIDCVCISLSRDSLKVVEFSIHCCISLRVGLFRFPCGDGLNLLLNRRCHLGKSSLVLYMDAMTTKPM